MQKIGLLLRDLSCSELNCTLLKQVNDLSDEGIINPVIFIEEANNIFIQPKCTVMQAYELWGFHENVICFNLSSAQKLLSIPTIKKKVFYVWDFEWLRFKTPNYQLMKSIYANKELEIINRTEFRQKEYEEMWNKQSIFNMEGFDVLKVLEILK